MRSSRRSSPSLRTPFGILAALVILLAGCDSAGPSAGPMTVHDAWIRLPAGGLTAGYLVIDNRTARADVLESVTIPSGGSVMLHRTTTDASGMTGMSPVDGIHVPAGGTVTLEPGGFHMMIDGLTSVAAGDKVDLHLMFEQAGEIVVQAEVRAG